MAKKNAAPTKSEILAQISKDTGLPKKQVSDVFDSLGGVVKKSLKSSGLFTLPGLLKMKVVKKPATKAREGVRSEEHTSELQSRENLVCRLLLEKKKKYRDKK